MKFTLVNGWQIFRFVVLKSTRDLSVLLERTEGTAQLCTSWGDKEVFPVNGESVSDVAERAEASHL